LALALITRDAPHLLILDEPTNHLDVDAREALVQALNEYKGAVVVVSHDRHMLELTADRLVLVDDGKAEEFSGSLNDYTDFVLGKKPETASNTNTPSSGNRKENRRAAAEAREKNNGLRKAVKTAESAMAKFGKELSALDLAMFDPSEADPAHAKLTMTELMKLRAGVASGLEEAEASWVEASEALENAKAAAA